MARKKGSRDKKKRAIRAGLIGASGVGLSGAAFGLTSLGLRKQTKEAKYQINRSKQVLKSVAEKELKESNITAQEALRRAQDPDARKLSAFIGESTTEMANRVRNEIKGNELANTKKFTRKLNTYRGIKAGAAVAGLGAGIGLGAYLVNRGNSNAKKNRR